MSKVETDVEEDKPLDPEMEKVRRKMVRLLVVSIGVMFLGVMAVLGGVVYKIIDGDGSQVAEARSVSDGGPLEMTAQLPSGFSVDSVSLDGSNILFFGRDNGGRQQALVFDMDSGRLAARIDVQR